MTGAVKERNLYVGFLFVCAGERGMGRMIFGMPAEIKINESLIDRMTMQIQEERGYDALLILGITELEEWGGDMERSWFKEVNEAHIRTATEIMQGTRCSNIVCDVCPFNEKNTLVADVNCSAILFEHNDMKDYYNEIENLAAQFVGTFREGVRVEGDCQRYRIIKHFIDDSGKVQIRNVKGAFNKEFAYKYMIEELQRLQHHKGTITYFTVELI